MKVLITGATGFIGRNSVEALFSAGHKDIRILTRSKSKGNFSLPVEVFGWNPTDSYIEENALGSIL